MKFGVLANTSISDWQLAVFAEDLGYDSIWFGDSQMICPSFGDSALIR